MVAAIENRRVLKRINRVAEEEEEEEETWGARVVQVQDREPRGRDDRMRQQVHCTSSFRDPVDLTLSPRSYVYVYVYRLRCRIMERYR